jgi:hypothetical protein
MRLLAARHGSSPSGPNAAFAPEKGSNTTTFSEPLEELLLDPPEPLDELDEPHPATRAASANADKRAIKARRRVTNRRSIALLHIRVAQ